jgi:hypothetical protein
LRTGLAGTIFTAGLEHDPEKRVTVFLATNAETRLRGDHAQIKQTEAGRLFEEKSSRSKDNPFTTSSRFQLTYTMTDDDERELENELARLQQEHRDLDAAIDALHQSPAPDLLRLQRLKKRKLQLRDRIAFIEDQITPDIIA